MKKSEEAKQETQGVLDTVFLEDGKLNESPPVFTTWNQLYTFVLVLHILIITILYFLTQHYS